MTGLRALGDLTHQIGKIRDKQSVSWAVTSQYTFDVVWLDNKWYADVQQVWVYDIMTPVYVDGELYGAFDIGVPITEVSTAV